MTAAVSWVLMSWLWGLQALAFAETQAGEPIKTTVCEIAKHPETYDGKVVEVRALVDSGVEDLPAGVSDDSCGAALKFFTPDDLHFRGLVKSKAFQKLIKDVKKNPVVEATVTGLFRRSIPHQGPDDKPQPGLALEGVTDIVVHPQPHVRGQKR